VKVEGHANPVLRTATEEKNELQPLSESRAKAVLAELVRYGVNEDRLSAIGMGGTRRSWK
jgi:outer membrane protein OmpA-like peptidoglycan-associated protein